MSRGRGRGNGMSLTNEQLQAMEIPRKDSTTTQTLAPPPLFPKLEAKPLPLPSDSATDYMLIVKDQFIECLHESPAYVKLRAKNDNIERYSDKYKLLALDSKNTGTLQCVWTNIPTELRPLSRKERLATRKRKLDDKIDIVKKFQTLEKEEMDDSMKKPQNTDEKMKGDQDSDNENVEEEQEQEFEADEGTDYANNYFDNGDDYDDEDDNLDDDPVY